ncbi:insulinase family protein [archaeon]|nr:insulinase family protein [archaeon]MBT4241705.1 insulinase family protein [archaeon]MBT4418253.1 insulinase family protein [archaeon]
MKEPEFHRKKLDNGLTVIFEKRDTPVVAVASSVKFGAQHESENNKGISHFIEHLVFKGTKNRSVTEIPEDIEGKGGVLNAFTAEEVTCFWNKMPAKHFSLGADVSRDLVLNPLFEAEALERERKVILEEIKMYHDNPSSFVLEKIKELMYKKPFNMSIAGTHESVKGLSRERVMELFDSIYSTNNMIFSVVGDVEFDEVLVEAKKFPKIEKTIRKMPIVKKKGESIEKRKGIDQAHSVLGFHMPKLNDKNRYAAEVFDSILGGGMSSRLFQEIREKRGLCYAIKSHLEQSKDYSYLLIYSGTVKEKVEEIKKLALKEVKKLGELKKSDFEEAKERLIGLRKISKEKSDSTMIELLQEELGGDAKRYYEYENEVGKVKLEDVRALSKFKEYSFVALVPE